MMADAKGTKRLFGENWLQVSFDCVLVTRSRLRATKCDPLAKIRRFLGLKCKIDLALRLIQWQTLSQSLARIAWMSIRFFFTFLCFTFLWIPNFSKKHRFCFFGSNQKTKSLSLLWKVFRSSPVKPLLSPTSTVELGKCTSMSAVHYNLNQRHPTIA